MNTEILKQLQSEVRTDQPVDGAQQHAVPGRPRREPTDSIGARTDLRECDLLVADFDAPVALETQPFAEAWRLVEGKRFREIERELQTKGWNVFYLIPDVRAAGIARDPGRAVRRALRKICRSAVERGVNMVEIASLRVDRLWGFHRATVRTKLRHVQESPYLFHTHEEMHERERMFRIKPPPRPVQVTPGFVGRDYAELIAIVTGRTQ